MTDWVLKDREERRQISEDLDTSILVEAGAGSGKTYSMVERMAALVKEGKCGAGEMAAVTFTRKAAAELKGKFQLALEKTLFEETDSEKRKRINTAIDELDRCFLGTIHSFCARLLRERPVEAGLDPDFEEIEQAEDALIRQSAWQDYLDRVQADMPEKMEELAKLDVDARELEGFYGMLSTYPEVEVSRRDVPAPDLGPVREELNNYLDNVRNMLPGDVPQKGWDNLQKMVRKALRWRRLFGFEDDLVFLRLLEGLEKQGNITQNRWPDKEDAKSAKKEFDRLQEEYIFPALRQWREHRHKRLVKFVLPAVDEYERRRVEQSRLNFQDLLLRAARLLKHNPEVRRYFRGRYTHLLVDEFQDTDPIQAEIMFYLTGEDTEERDWRKLVPRPGSLFVVGDPKQAIYRFRRADIDTYNEVKHLLEKNGGKVLRLITNFRSLQEIGQWVNPVFRGLLPGESTTYQAPFAELDAVRERESEAAGGVKKISIPKIYRDNQKEIALQDAEKIARWVRWAVDGGISLSGSEKGENRKPVPGDFMIILRYKAFMELYARALEKEGIPVRIAGSAGFSGSEETSELLKVLRAVMEPDHPVHLAAVLRGIFFGISDNQLWLYKQAGGKFNIYSKVPGDLSVEDREALEHAFSTLGRFRKYALDMQACAALEKIIEELGVIPYALSGEPGQSRCGYVLHARELLAAASRSGVTSFSSLVEHLAFLYESGEVEEEINITPWQEDAVSLMNLHKAKGLEAPVVFLANPGRDVSIEPSQHIDRVSEDTAQGYFLIKNNRKVLGRPVDWDRYREIEQQYLDAEETRLLYVAATRAMDLLVVSTYEGKPEKSPWHPFNAHLEDVEFIEEIEREEEPAASSEAKGREITARDLKEARESFLGPTSSICTPGYTLAPVTSLVKDGEKYPGVEDTGRGLSWGRVMHRVLEARAKNSTSHLVLFIEKVLSEEKRDPGEKDQVMECMEKVTFSHLWQRMRESEQLYTEVPFSKKVKDQYGIEGEAVVSGVVDLAFLKNDGWVLVDYKTDTVEDDSMLDRLARYYAPQVQLYKQFWEELTGMTVKEAGLYFTHLDKWLPQ